MTNKEAARHIDDNLFSIPSPTLKQAMEKGAAALRTLDSAREKLAVRKAELTETLNSINKWTDPFGWSEAYYKIQACEELEKMLGGD